MRRIDVITIGLATFLGGGAVYAILLAIGLEAAQAGIWSQVVLVIGLVGWLLTYLYRAVNHKMTYSQQLQNYKEAVLQKRLDEMTPEELARLQAEIDQEQEQSSPPSS